MTKLVKLDVYSGRPNPVWTLSDDLSTQLSTQTGAAPSDGGQGLGYRGFKIIESSSDVQQMATTEDLIGDFSVTSTIFGSADLEKSLMQSGVQAGAIDSGLAGYLADCFGSSASSGSSLTASGGSCPTCGGADAPSYDPGKWNNDPAVQRGNNCYAYANNNPTGTFPQPGRGSGQIFASLDCDGVRPASEKDGLVTTSTYQASRAGWYVALVIWPGQDYHWYRQDDGGCWSHKPGQTPARNTDNSGAAISDPQQCDRGPYTTFCTFMVSSSSVTIS